MKLKKLFIKEYKNLKDFTIDFESGNGISILVGNNGSGKSNVLEAISGIFANAYSAKAVHKFVYSLIYEIQEKEVKLEQTIYRCQYYVDGKVTSVKELATQGLLPTNVIALYSGEDKRWWHNYYEFYYKAYIRRIKTNQHQESMHLMLINKYYWNIALLALLLSSNETLSSFIKDELNINSVTKIELTFDFRHFDNLNELLKTFIDRINPEHKIRKSYTLEELKECIFFNILTDANGNVLVDENDNILVDDSGLTDREVFRYLTQGFMPKQEKILREITIYLGDDITVQQLSEGEKKLILVKTVLEILSDEKTLLLMDEPDAHLHEARKKNLYSIMREYPNRQIVLASHSPTFIDVADIDEIRMLNINENGNAELYESNKIDLIRKLTGSRLNVFLEKPILYCEGTETSLESDLYPMLFPDYKVIPSGGHEEVIHLTKMYNGQFKDSTHYAIGVIDWDYKTDEELASLKESGIYSLKVVEIENVLLDLTILEAAKEDFCADEECIDKVKQALFSHCTTYKELQAKKYTASRIVSQIKSTISPEGRTIEAFKSKIAEACDVNKIDKLYNQRLNDLEVFLHSNAFDDIVKIYDFNHHIDHIVKAIVDNYQNRILRLIQKREDLKEYLKSNYYSEIE